MRITGGELGGRRLAGPPGRSREVRPTSDRAREAIFSILGGSVSGAQVLDLFSGTGALGIEAISRGAASATLVDRRPALAERNVRDLGLGGSCRVERGDALAYLRRARATFDLVFCDPPYNIADRLEPDLDSLLPKCLAEDARVILESSARQPIALSLELLEERRYGEASMRIYRGGKN